MRDGERIFYCPASKTFVGRGLDITFIVNIYFIICNQWFLPITTAIFSYYICPGTTNTVLHYHANIRQALQHAFEMDMIPSNPADKVKRLKKNQFIGSYYTSDELNDLFEVVKGDPVELAVILAAFYGLRRSEIVGLKWNAINFQHQTITIKHTVIPVSYEGKQIIVAKDRAKNKSSYRTLPLVPVFLELLLRLLEEQQANRALYKDSYSNQYQDYIYVNKLGERIKPGYITQHWWCTIVCVPWFGAFQATKK